MIDRAAFFDGVRKQPFGGMMTPNQVSGVTAVLDEWERRALTDLRWLAYMLATAFWETARTMKPIAEYGRGKGHAYGNPVNGKTYYGRGYVQLTWDYNYKKMGDLLGVDLLGNPDLALDPKVAAEILFEGMIRGSFTGRKLADYFTTATADWTNARKIINGLDKADTIAGFAKQFYAALTAAKAATASPVPAPPVNQPAPVPPSAPPASNAGWVAALILLIASLFKRKSS